VVGLSVGAALALRLAEVHGPDVAGIVAVNPSLRSHQRSLALLPFLEKILPSVRGVVDDVAKPGTTEGGYDRMPLRALRSLTELWAITRADLAKVDQPLLVYRSAVDHVVDAASTVLLFNNIRSVDAEERVLHNSFHVATLDHDAELIFSGSLEFIRRLSPVHLPDPSLAVQD
jgi:carboxylesterase